MLVIHKSGVPFVVYTDVSLQGLDGFIIQQERVAAYVSQQLRVHELNYLTYGLNLAVVFHLGMTSLLVQRDF